MSNLSNVSRVFYNVAIKRSDYERYEIEELKEDKIFYFLKG